MCYIEGERKGKTRRRKRRCERGRYAHTEVGEQEGGRGGFSLYTFWILAVKKVTVYFHYGQMGIVWTFICFGGHRAPNTVVTPREIRSVNIPLYAYTLLFALDLCEQQLTRVCVSTWERWEHSKIQFHCKQTIHHFREANVHTQWWLLGGFWVSGNWSNFARY